MSDLPTREEAQRLVDNPYMRDHLTKSFDPWNTVVKAYADGRLIDGQAIADAWNKSKKLAPENGREFAQVIALLDALAEENNGGEPSS